MKNESVRFCPFCGQNIKEDFCGHIIKESTTEEIRVECDKTKNKVTMWISEK